MAGGFDAEAARAAGYSEGDIVDFLARENRFDAGAARQSGYSDAEIIQHLSGPAPAPREVPPAPALSGGLQGAAMQGLTFGFGDEFNAAVRATVQGLPGMQGAPTWGERYDSALGRERTAANEYRRDSPIAAAAGNIVGGVANPLGRLPIFNPGTSASLPGAMVRGAAAGAAAGGVTGFGEGEGGLEGRAGSALVGGGLGAVVGGAVPALVEGGRAVAGAVGRRVSPASGAQDAERIILRDLARDGMTPDELLARVQESRAAGRPETIADLGGGNVLGTSAAVARAPGQGRQAATDLVEARGGRAQAERLTAEVRRAVSGDDFRATVSDLTAQRSRTAAPLYDRAYAVQLPDDPRLNSFLTDPDVAAGVRRGLDLARREALADPNALPFRPADLGVDVAQDGSISLTGGASTRLLDIAKRGMDAMIDGATDGAERRSLRQVRNAMVARLDELNPAYAQARAAYAGPSASLDALAMGRRLLTEGVDAAEETARDIARLSPSEREFFRTGVARALTDRISAAGDNADLTRLRQVWQSDRVRERLRAAFDSDADFRAFAGALDAEARMAATNRAVAPNAGSQTAPLQERMADLRNPPSGSPVVDPNRQAMSGGLGRDLMDAWRTGGITAPVPRIIQRLQEGAQQSRLERNMDTLAPMLFGRDPAEQEKVARAIMARALGDRRTQQVINPRIRAIARGLAVGGAIEAND